MIPYEVGDIVRYIPHDGGQRTAVVTEKYDDIKNGRPGFDGVTAGGLEVWGYNDQIVRVL